MTTVGLVATIKSHSTYIFTGRYVFQQISVSWFIITINNHGHTYWLLQSCFHQVKVVFMLGLAGDDELEDEGEAEQRNRYCPCHHQFCYQCFLDMFFGCVTLKVRKPSVADIRSTKIKSTKDRRKKERQGTEGDGCSIPLSRPRIARLSANNIADNTR